jgi:hypothetical protein
MVELFKQISSLIIIRLLLLLYVAKGSSSLDLHEKRMIQNWIFKPCKGKPNSHAWNIQRLFRSNRLPFIPTHGSVPPQVTIGPYAHPMCRTYVCSATTWLYSCPLCETYSYSVCDYRMYSHPLRNILPHVGVCAKNQIMSGGGYVHHSGRSVTRLTAYHISWHVGSTFKRLTTATTHCDLIKFSLTQTVFLQKSWIIITTPSVILIVVAGM